MDQRLLVKGRIANFGRFLDVFRVFVFWTIFSVFQTIRVFGYSWSIRKPLFPMDKRPLVQGPIANFGIFLDVFGFFAFQIILSIFQKKISFLGILGYSTVVSVLPSASVERCFVSCMRDFVLGGQQINRHTDTQSHNDLQTFCFNWPIGWLSKKWTQYWQQMIRYFKKQYFTKFQMIRQCN